VKNPGIWFPYAQMKTMPPPYEVVSADGVRLRLADGRELIDGIASWWCMIHGYGNRELKEAMRAQAEKLPHVMLGGIIHPAARELADKLVEITPEGLNHVFYSDSGSVGVEVALKMAAQFWLNRGRKKTKFIALKKAYHGDTTGCMSVCDPDNGMHKLFGGLLPKQYFLPAPTGGYNASEEDIRRQLAELEKLLEKKHREIAAFICEPLLQAAGGFNIYSPHYLRGARELCDRFDVLLIFDEIATGFGRTGKMFAAEKAGVTPDIMVLGKGLTAGYLGHAATLANDRVFDGFYDDDPGKALMHGPTFMGNATVCALALKSIEIFERENYLDKIARIEKILREELLTLKSEKIKETRVLGAAGIIETHERQALAGIQEFAVARGVWVRPFGKYVYTVPPYIISDSELRQVTDVFREWFQGKRG
jgi:adenosylmethionine-8-amino-7-oxononanoate aminotransferase